MPWVYDIRLPKWVSPGMKCTVIEKLNEEGIAARHGFQPMHLQQEYKTCRRVGGSKAEEMGNRIMYLPLSPGTNAAQVETAFQIIHQVLHGS